jgi:hypothetical protein
MPDDEGRDITGKDVALATRRKKKEVKKTLWTTEVWRLRKQITVEVKVGKP